ncbi:MAG: UvrD-helicase domain-containing protein [bacterium]
MTSRAAPGAMAPLDPFNVALQGVQLVEASAGTGKTHAITTLVVRAVLERGLDIGRILVVTFTNAATAELRDRVRKRLRAMHDALEDPARSDDDELRLLVERRPVEARAADRQRLLAALYGFDEAAIFTIHGFCQRVLQEFAFESGVRFDTELLGDARTVLADVVRDYRVEQLYAAAPELLAALKKPRVDHARLTAIAQQFLRHPRLRVLELPPADQLGGAEQRAVRALVQGVGPYARAALARRKAGANAQFFDDLLQDLGAALAGLHGAALAATLRRRYPMALIDEFQDTDPVQFDIFRRIYAVPDAGAEAALFLIGDPKQAIYAFRGADVFTYFAANALADGRHTLPTNRRSSPSLVQAVNAVFNVRPDALVLDEMRFRDVAAARADTPLGGAAGQAPLRIWFAERSRGDFPLRKYRPKQILSPNHASHPFFGAVADAAVRLLDGSTSIDGKVVEPGDVAILCRTNAQLLLIQTALRAADVPSVVLGDSSVFETAEASMLERLLRALAEPGDAAAVRAALTTPLLGRCGEDLDRLREDEAEWETVIERFQGWGARWRSGGFTSAFRAVLDDEGVPGRLLAQPGGERALTNLLHLGEMLQRAASAERRGPLALVEWLRRLRLDVAARDEQAVEAAQIRLESDVRALKLTTVHKSKGLQYPVVVCPFLWSIGRRDDPDAPPLFHADGEIRLDLRWPADEQSRRAAEIEQQAESTRLTYVALTRARDLCIVVWGAFWNFEESALAHLWHGLERRDASAKRSPDDIKALTDQAMRADLDAYAQAAPGAIEIVPLEAPRQLRFTPTSVMSAALVAPPAVSPVRQPWRVSSFTALAAGGEGLGLRAEEGIDRDELTSPEPIGVAGLGGFPRGRRPGTLVHAVFERIDFTQRDPAVLRAVVRDLLATFRVDLTLDGALCAAVDDVLDTPLDAGQPPLHLRDVPVARRLNEMEFAFPIGLGADGQTHGGLTPLRLSQTLAAHAGSLAARAYAARLARLPFRTLAGYLRGFIDLVFQHDGRWYVVDYKSNDLGPRAADYAPTGLAAAMAQHDYILQAHLYAVAVHRYLGQRVADYDYRRHFGGVYYLFVRGMHPSRGATTGVVFDRPTPDLIGALDALLTGGA